MTDQGGLSSENPRDSLAEHLGFEAKFRREHPFLWSLTLFGPFATTALAVLLLYWVTDAETMRMLLYASVVAWFAAGRFIILAGSDGDTHLIEGVEFFTSGQLFLMVLFMDIMTAIVLIFHMGVLFRIPFVGPKMEALVEDGQFILKSNPWMRRATFAGIVAFVMFPLAATGSVGGSIFARLLGLTRTMAFLGIIIGSVLGCSVMFFGAEFVRTYVLETGSTWRNVGGLAVIAALVFLLNWRYRQMKAKYLAKEAHAGDSQSAA